MQHSFEWGESSSNKHVLVPDSPLRFGKKEFDL